MTVSLEENAQYSPCESKPIDVVYTWVNGSDPSFIDLKNKYVKDDSSIVNSASKRFQDWETLKYSIRSLGMFAPWVRNIYIVTNGQVPAWLKITDGIKIITHDEIFENKSDLPTFNSNAIDLYLHKIPGLSEKYLFFNDDMLLGNNLYKEDICRGQDGQKIYLSNTKVIHCAKGCSNEWLGNGICELPCNCSTCLYDKGDCSDNFPLDRHSFEPADNDTWMRSLTKWNIIFNRDFGFAERRYPMHQGTLFDKRIKEAFNAKYRHEVIRTAKNKFRSDEDVQLQFTYVYFLHENSKKLSTQTHFQKLSSKPFNKHPNHSHINYLAKYEHETLEDKGLHANVAMEGNVELTSQILYELSRWGLPKFVCIQDATQDLQADLDLELHQTVTYYLELYYSEKSKFEL